MLNKIRKASNSLIVRIILGLIALSFVGVGGASFINGNSMGDVVSFSDTKSISMEEFQFAKANEIDMIQRENGISLNENQISELNIDDNVIRKLIHDSMIKYLARLYNFDVSDEKVISFIHNAPFFKNSDGKFDLKIFQAAFNNSPKKEEEYINSVKDQLVLSSLYNIFIYSFNPARRLTDNMIQYMSETRSADIISIDLDFKPKSYKAKEITSEEVEEFYNKNQDLFVLPESRAFDYILVEEDYLIKKISISEAELEQYFTENINDFSKNKFSEAKKEVREVILQEKIEELAGELAKNLEEDVASGLNLSEIANKYNIELKSQKPISFAKMSSNEKSELAEIADNVFELSDGEVSYPIEIQGKNNIVLIELKSIDLPRQKTIAEVENELKNIMEKHNIARDNIKTIEEHRKLYNPKTNNIKKSQNNGLKIVMNQKYIKADLAMNDKLPPELLKFMFEVANDQSTPIVSDGKKLYFARVNSIQSNSSIAKKISDNSKEHFVNAVRESVLHDIIANLSMINKMQISQKL